MNKHMYGTNTYTCMAQGNTTTIILYCRTIFVSNSYTCVHVNTSAGECQAAFELTLLPVTGFTEDWLRIINNVIMKPNAIY